MNEITDTIYQEDFPNKNYAYYSIDQNQVFDLEPNINTWDFVFTKYVAEVAPGVFYPVTGVLHNSNTLSVKVANVDIASVDAGASAASYGEPALLPLGVTYTHMRVTIDRKFTIKNSGT